MGGGVMEKLRLRLVFDGQRILSDTQKKEGLKKTWILLKPKQFNTISNLTDYILRIFHLNHSCPHGLVLSMDGFVLPPFESSRILNDNDIVCVRRKRGASTEIIELNGANALEGVKTLKQPGHTGLKLLANVEFEKETGEYESEPDDADEREKQEDIPDVNKVSKKRKRSKKLQGSKRKKSKLSTAEESPVVLEDVRNDAHEVKRGSSRYCSLLKKDKSSDVQGEPEKPSAPEHMPDAKRFSQIQENGEENVDLSSKKLPSRSARRKKAKRRWLREQANLEKMKLHQKQLFAEDNLVSLDKGDQNLSTEHRQQDSNSHGKDIKGLSEGYRQSNLNCDANDDVVPVLIRPGHIRFEPFDKVDSAQTVQQNHIPVESFQWNGITSKKKGQKWGKEKAVFSKRSSHGNFNQFSETLPIEEESPIRKDTDFDKLPHYTSLPKEGDVIAYRLIELSLSWTPEPTTFRVGMISLYDSETNRIMLAPVPEYPVVFEKKTDEDASAMQSDTLYGDDGSLQIDFSLLLDVRIVTHGGEINAVRGREQDTLSNLGNSNKHEQALAPNQENGKASVGDQDAVSNVGDNSNNEKTHALSQENGNLNAWEEINQALCTKKAELSEAVDPSRKDSSNHSGRLSYKALRSSALGPTMAFLRSQNEL